MDLLDGYMMWLVQVEVVNRLKKDMVYETVKNYTVHYDQTWIFDKIHHEINQVESRNFRNCEHKLLLMLSLSKLTVLLGTYSEGGLYHSIRHTG